MYVATIIPIARGIPFDTLSYYCPENLSSGTLVSIPFGKQIIAGIVLETIVLSEAKATIKHAKFALKKIKQVLGVFPYFEKVALAIEMTATLTLAPVGAIAGSVIPQFIFEYINKEKITEILSSDENDSKVFIEKVCIGTTQERTDYYKRLVRSAFANKSSVLFICPTIRGLESWQEKLEKGIQKHVIVMHSKTSKKNLRSYFSLIKSSTRPLLIFTTPSYAVIPRFDINQAIVESESSNLYKTSDRYGIDLRIFIKNFCEQSLMTLHWGDTIPRFETLSRLGEEHLPRAFIPDKLHIVPVEHYRTTLPSEVIELLRHAEVKKRRIFIYTNRKGVAPLSRCSDCATIVACPTCSLPMVLRNINKSDGMKERSFICTHCGDSLPPEHLCVYCGGWNIVPLAIGTESLRDEVASLIGSENVFTIDDDITPDSTTIETLIREFGQKKFAVIIGTVKILPYLKGIEYTIVPFFDRLLSTPSLYTTEQVLRMIMECNELSGRGVLLCTRNPDFPIIKQLETHKINAIVHDELETRRDLGYPPYGSLIKISMTIPEGYRQKMKEHIEEYLQGKDFTALAPRRVSLGSMKVLMVWILKTRNEYIEEEGPELAQFLNSLRFPYRIEQNPERL